MILRTLTRTMIFGWLGLVVVTGGGCGGETESTVACTTNSGSTQQCFETSTNHPAAGGLAAANQDCTNGGGVSSAMCPRAGADGGCRMTQTVGPITVSTTFWFYKGMAASEMAGCTKNGNSWISP